MTLLLYTAGVNWVDWSSSDDRATDYRAFMHSMVDGIVLLENLLYLTSLSDDL